MLSSAGPGTVTQLDQQHAGCQHPIGFGELQSPVDVLKTLLLQLLELQKLLEPVGLAG